MSDSTTGRTNPVGNRELIVVLSPDTAASVTKFLADSLDASNKGGLFETLGRFNARLVPLRDPKIQFQQAPDLSDKAKSSTLNRYCYVDARDEDLEKLAEELPRHSEVASAYIKPAGEPPTIASGTSHSINTMQPGASAPTTTTPKFVDRQIYLGPAPSGIDAEYGWSIPGGKGTGVKIIDCEWAWRTSHEDLQNNKGGVVVGEASMDDNHGTAVLGVIGADDNDLGVTGISPESFIRLAAFSMPTATVIDQAAALLGPGDILLLEIQRRGPRATGNGQEGYIAIEWWPDDFAAIQAAVQRGVIVVEAGGNGAENLDDPAYDTPAPGFPPDWKNPFNRSVVDSGAIIVGAGAPPPGTHGADWGIDRSRLNFSNYGSCIDVQGWGREVTTTGYGDLQGGPNPDVWYSNTFSGTSSASPIIVGTIACLQGILRARHSTLLNPGQVRRLLRNTGSPQQDTPNRPATQRIGNRPDLRAIVLEL